MALAAAAVLLGLAGVIRGLRHGFYALHLAIVVGLAWLLQQQFGFETLLVRRALISFLALHLLSINLVAFLAYAYDKHAAKRYKWRVPERTLHAFALIGGTPAALYAQKLFRHKTKKKSFRRHVWAILIFQLVALFGLLFMR